MKNIIKKWLDDHRIRWKEDIYKIPEERIDLLITMLRSEPKECSCGIEYDENREQYITLCEKHKNDEEVRLRKEYENNQVSGGDKYPNSTGGSGGTTCGSRYSDNIYWSEPTKDDAPEEKCNHFFLPAKVNRGRDVFNVERVYCAKCGKNCYADLSDLRERIQI